MQPVISPAELNIIAREFGTPVYVYHAETIEKQCLNLTKSFSTLPVRFFYACKALTNPHIIRLVHKHGLNIDCSSIFEAQLALLAGVPPHAVLYTSNGIDFAEIEAAVALGIKVNIDSLSNLHKFGKRFGNSVPVGVRIRPNIMAGGNLKISTGHSESKFGIAIDQVDALLQIMHQFNLQIDCLHIHTGSEVDDAEIFVKGVEVLFDLLPNFPQVKYLDLGGGFKVSYKEGDKVTNLQLLAEKVSQMLAEHASEQVRKLEIWFEPGKYVVSEAGFLLTKVNVLKDSEGMTFVGVDSGFNHLIRPMLYDSYHHILNVSNQSETKKYYNVVGNICETDTFAWHRQIPEIQEGDVLAILNAGAYGFQMASNYNSRPRPAELLVENGVPRIIRRAETLQDQLNTLINL